ncbi:MAG: DNA polymerase III subunit gamma/tau [Spirochaetales bacterium]|jgi:DNA polymerase-3 subunit gamma/tau|nr:DNA polymerase III subunit gamma/tau [Spirochaetales bacterium]
MAYEVTATRKRPGSFEDLAGQEFVVSTLKNSLVNGQIAHAYLFSGPRGVGKTSAARILARALNCQESPGPTPAPCGRCPSCLEIVKGRSLDVIEIDGASNTSVNDIRELRDEVLFAPSSGRYKVYIIDEVHMLSTSAFNALLKTIEEPPPYIVFIFATTEIHKVPLTIRSRCQQFNFRLINQEEIRRLLAQVCRENGIEAEEAALLWIAKESTGSQRDAYTLFDQIAAFSGKNITLAGIKEKLGLVGMDELSEILTLAAEENTRGVLEKLDSCLNQGVSVEQVIIDLSEYFRGLLLLKHGITSQSILGCPASAFPEAVAGAFSEEQIERALEWFFQLFRDLRFSLNPKHELELLLSRLAQIKSYLSSREILARIKDLRRQAGLPAESPPLPRAALDSSPSRPAPVNPPAEQTPEEALKASLLAFIRKQKLSLHAAMEQAVGWEIGESEIVITFGNDFNALKVKDERTFLRETLKTLTGRDYRINICSESAAARQPGGFSGDPPLSENQETGDQVVETVVKIFRGEIVGEEK